MKKNPENCNLSIGFHYLCNQNSSIRISETKHSILKPSVHPVRLHYEFNQFKKITLEDLNDC